MIKQLSEMARKRYLSLDVFRGATVCLMILVNNPGTWSAIYAPLRHADWHGLTPTDLVFPFFLFAVGNAMAFVIPRFKNQPSGEFWKKVLKRSVIIFGIGLFLNWYPFISIQEGNYVWKSWSGGDSMHGVRIMGVLQRIAIAYLLSSIIVFYAKPKMAFYTAIGLLVVYWLILWIGNPSDPYSIQGYTGNLLDRFILGENHLYRGEGIPFDPEGLLSTIPCVSQVIFGYVVGCKIINNGKQDIQVDGLVARLFIWAVGFFMAGYFWSLHFPVNKKIWTSSYVLVTTGLAIVTIATIIYFVEFRKKKLWLSSFFNVFGKNPLFIFALSAFLPRTARLFPLDSGSTLWSYPYHKIFARLPGSPEFGSLIYALWVILFMWFIAYLLDRKKIYIKV